MDIFARFAKVSASNIVRVNTLEVGKRYPIKYAQRQETIYGPSVLLSLHVGDSDDVKVFLPKRFSLVFEDEDIIKINNGTLALHLIYHALYLGTRAHKLTLEH
jgi:hypothetical protein